MSKVIFITWDFIHPSNNGYKKSVNGRIEESKIDNDEVMVIQVRNDGALDKNRIKEYSDGIIKNVNIEVPKLKGLNIVKSIFSIKTREEILYGTYEIGSVINRLITEFNPDYIQVEGYWALGILPKSINKPVRLVVHDVMKNLYLSDIKSNSSYFQKINSLNKLLRTFAFESKNIKEYNISEVIYLTNDDKKWYLKKLNHIKIH
uniref:hypothetical protein n=1 Tax=Rosenbergiella metrosideri TaxID=2921185 RepID=UPI001F4FB6DA